MVEDVLSGCKIKAAEFSVLLIYRCDNSVLPSIHRLVLINSNFTLIRYNNIRFNKKYGLNKS